MLERDILTDQITALATRSDPELLAVGAGYAGQVTLFDTQSGALWRPAVPWSGQHLPGFGRRPLRRCRHSRCSVAYLNYSAEELWYCEIPGPTNVSGLQGVGYHIERSLGSGASGRVVYQVLSDDLPQRAVLKVLRDDLRPDGPEAQGLRKEADASKASQPVRGVREPILADVARIASAAH